MNLLEVEHPELFHYTGAAGLHGIISSQKLHATHYKYLNDAAEVEHFLREKLPQIYERGFLKFINDKLVANRCGKERADRHRKILLEGSDPLAEPYFLSFSTSRDDRVIENGLLSQWRGYGKDGGYALVFDTKKLMEAQKEFGENKKSGDLFNGNVVYSSADDEAFSKGFEDPIKIIDKFLENDIKKSNTQEAEDHDPDTTEKIFLAIMKCACCYKHWGFEEENEVRTVYIPLNKAMIEDGEKNGEVIKKLPQKHRVRSGLLVPYVELYEGVTSKSRPLPIRRVIVGPCPEHEKAMRIRAVQLLLDENGLSSTKVCPSKIPYIGN